MRCGAPDGVCHAVSGWRNNPLDALIEIGDGRAPAVVDMSYYYDMSATPVHWEELLDEVETATKDLQDSSVVPSGVAQLIDSLDPALHAGAPMSLDTDPYLSTALFAAAFRAEKALRHDDVEAQRRDLRLALEQFRHALRDIVGNRPFDADVPIQDVLERTVAVLSAPQREIAGLFGVSQRQLQRWLAKDGSRPSGADEARIRVVGQLVNQLKHSFTAPGVLAWFHRAHPELKVVPAEWLDDPLRYPGLLGAARAARSMTG